MNLKEIPMKRFMFILVISMLASFPLAIVSHELFHLAVAKGLDRDPDSICWNLKPIENNEIAYVGYSEPIIINKMNIFIEEAIAFGIYTIILSVLSLYLTMKWFDYEN